MDPLHVLHAFGDCLQTIGPAKSLYFSMFMAGMVGGFTHCMAMCGPFVIAQSGQLTRWSDMALLPYHLGRITTYVVLAVLVSTVLNLAFFYLPIRSFVVAPILCFAAVIFLVSAFPGLRQVFPWSGMLKIVVPYRFIQKGFEKLSRNTGLLDRYMIGVLLGLMPCGLVMAAIMAASTAPSVAQTALAMAVFGLSTMPALIGVAIGAASLKTRYPALAGHVAKIMMVWSGFWLFFMAGLLFK